MSALRAGEGHSEADEVMWADFCQLLDGPQVQESLVLPGRGSHPRHCSPKHRLVEVDVVVS